jgi:hypothetical protein
MFRLRQHGIFSFIIAKLSLLEIMTTSTAAPIAIFLPTRTDPLYEAHPARQYPITLRDCRSDSNTPVCSDRSLLQGVLRET